MPPPSATAPTKGSGNPKLERLVAL